MVALLFVFSVLTAAGCLSETQAQTSSAPLPVVQTKLGVITGRVLTARNGRQYEGFRGIPYAKPPVGELRFSKPQPLLAFEHGQLDAGDFGKMCCQHYPGMGNFNPAVMSEDCLFLNVYRPHARGANETTQGVLRPVFVFIHGGGFQLGSADAYESSQLITDGNIIVVTLNYRLGALGFLSAGDSSLPGNYGLWDQHLAIRWVNDNIQAFGGDPGQITIGGESAGSISVSFQALSSLSRGLFNRAILQSGAATSGGMIQRKPLEILQGLARRVRCLDTGVSSNPDLLTCLRQLSADNFMSASYPDRTLARSSLDFIYVPAVDGDFLAKDPQAMLDDMDYLTQIGFYERDYLSGCVNNEGGLLSDDVQQQAGNVSLILDPSFYDFDLVPLLVEQKFGISLPAVEDVVKFFYTFPRFQGVTQLDLKRVLNAPGDTFFYVPVIEFARAIAKGQRSERRNLVYFFDHYPAYVVRGELGMTHGLDLLYEFDIRPEDFGFGNSSLWNSDDDHLRQVFISTIVGFVKTGDPSTALQPHLQDAWTNFELRNESYLSISARTLAVQRHLRARATSLWTDLLPNLLEPVSLQRNHTSARVPTLSELIG